MNNTCSSCGIHHKLPPMEAEHFLSHCFNMMKDINQSQIPPLISHLVLIKSDSPVVIDYRQSIINSEREATSVHDNEKEIGTEEGPCTFVVQGLNGEEYSTMSLEAIKA